MQLALSPNPLCVCHGQSAWPVHPGFCASQSRRLRLAAPSRTSTLKAVPRVFRLSEMPAAIPGSCCVHAALLPPGGRSVLPSLYPEDQPQGRNHCGLSAGNSEAEQAHALLSCFVSSFSARITLATLPNLPNLNFLFGEGGEDYSLETEVKRAKQLQQGPDHLGGYQNPASMSSVWASLAPSQ